MKDIVALAKSYKDYANQVNFNSGEWLVMRKIDGIRSIARNERGTPSFKTRTGKDLATMSVMGQRLAGLPDFVIDGELCSIDSNGNEDFKSIAKMALKKSGDIQNPTIKAFDFLSPSEFDNGISDKKYSERMNALNEFLCLNKIEGIVPLEWERVTSKEVFDKWLAKARAEGWEGLMLRKDVPYKNGRIAELLKVKDFQDAEYVVEGIEAGKLPYSDGGEGCECLKTIWIKHKGCRVDVGSGFTNDERIEFYENPSLIVGKVVTIAFFEESSNENGGVSLRFPTFKGICMGGSK